MARLMALIFVFLLSAFVLLPRADAQTTEITYQGQLQSSSASAIGTFDFEFLLFDSLTDGTQIGSTLTRSGIAIANGTFAVKLDFGASFPGANRFLEIHVRPTGAGAFTQLTPRQPVTSAPYAVKSLSADTAANAANATNAFNATNAQNAVNFSGALGGDVTGNQTVTTVEKLRTVPLPAPVVADNGKVLKYKNNGVDPITYEWATDNTSGGGGGGVSSVTASGPLASSGGATPNISLTGIVSAANGGTGLSAAGVAGNLLRSNGTNWTSSPLLAADIPSGSGNYIQNQNAATQPTSNFDISGTGNADIFNVATGYNIGGLRVLSIAGTNNVFAGISAGPTTSGSNNSFFGRGAGNNNGGGGNNAFFGHVAGFANNTGSNNAFFGKSAGFTNTTGANNTLIGSSADVGSGALSFATALGSGAVVNASNTVMLGRAADTVQVPGNLSVTGTLTGSGASLTALNASNLSTGTLADGRLAGAYTGALTLNNAGNAFTGSGAGLTGLNATNLASGTVADARLSTNVDLLNTVQTFSGAKTFSAMTVFNGNVGIGTAAPERNLHVFAGSAGTVTADSSAPLVVESDSNAFVNILSPDGAEKGILFGGPVSQFDGSIRYNNSGNLSGLQFRTNGNTTRMVVTSAGDVGIGTISPTAKLDVRGNISTPIIRGENASTSNGASGVYGLSTATGGLTYGVFGESSNPTGRAVYGHNTAATFGTAVYGVSESSSGKGVFGFAAAVSGTTYGVYGESDSPNGYAGYFVGPFGSLNYFQRSVGIGTNAPAQMLDVTGDIRIGISGTNGCLQNRSGGVIGGTCSSDLRFKRNVTPFGSVLNNFSKLRPVNFYWRADEFADKHFGPEQSYGLIAQEVEQAFPDLVSTDKQGYKAVNYSKLPLLTIQAVKEQQMQIESQQRQIEQQRKQIESLTKIVCAINSKAEICRHQ